MTVAEFAAVAVPKEVGVRIVLMLVVFGMLVVMSRLGLVMMVVLLLDGDGDGGGCGIDCGSGEVIVQLPAIPESLERGLGQRELAQHAHFLRIVELPNSIDARCSGGPSLKSLERCRLVGRRFAEAPLLFSESVVSIGLCSVTY